MVKTLERQGDLTISREFRDGVAEVIAEQKRRKRQERKKTEWSGNLERYLYLVKEYPQAAENTRERAWRVIFEEPGYTLITHETDPRRARMLGLQPGEAMRNWNSFREFVDLYGFLDRFAKFLESARRGGEAARQVPFPVGDTGTGKSQWVRKMFKLLVGENLYHIDGCPMHEHPLRALPMHDRLRLQELLGRAFDLEGDLCTQCSFRLKTKWKRWERIPITTSRLSVRRRIGLVTVYPVDPNNQDVRVLIGAESVRRLLQFEEGHPLLGNYAGAFNQGEGGIIEFAELTMNPPDFLHIIIGQTQEQLVPAPGFYGNVSSDAIVIGHSNWEPFEAFRNTGKNVAIMDRIEPFFVPYVLSYQNLAENLYPQMLARAQKTGVHFSPLALEATARFQVESARQREPEADQGQHVELDEWVELRNGTNIRCNHDVRHLNSVYPNDGRKGVSPRLTVKALEACESDLAIGYGNDRDPKHKCVSPQMVIDELFPRVRSTYEGPRFEEVQKSNLSTLRAYLPRILKERTLEILQRLLETPRVKEEVAVALAESLQGLARRYLELISQDAVYRRWAVMVPREGSPPAKPGEAEYAFLDRIESKLKLPLDARPKFREELLAFKQRAEDCGKPFDISEHKAFNLVLLDIFFENSHGPFERLFARMQKDETLVQLMADELTRLGAERDDNQEGIGILRLSWCPVCTLQLVEYVATREWQS
ncbi:MAG: hypothetical protein A2806_00275 [Candidatus Terrybacteria bacterium RIFCSPHIGHO2_01_FULL_48_17]|uniref:PrkA AAA domain-containing protein n=1 Tax=Candidatus Terrybacteria bacterium RIFCSPHIGHO2_01_FULL_48_17 TaxID=1802362 RepID=A0A1G2PLU0_9BACT|nr:MAG: hypothetical protein A2806_00275 [Candidatus Terrybacteria bacterium RIFCSPHIGHO2_01_FULL_48_17]OHA53651.1 MAG: hypothetical protein A3A30_00595 [Candidatus Terrybacteria bacterium RIFCSPLOWO2_01_FULL_48_14]